MKNFYGSFKTWLISKYPSTGTPSEEEWLTIMAEDAMSYMTSCGDDTENASGEGGDEDLDVDLSNDTATYATLCYNIS